MKTKFIAILSVLLFIPVIASAHLGGTIKESGDYRIELGRYPKETLGVEETANFTLFLEEKGASHIEHVQAWVRISRGDQILFSSTSLRSQEGNIQFDYAFPSAGDYKVDVRMVDVAKDQEATVTFPVTVEGKSPIDETLGRQNRQQLNLTVLVFFGGLVIGGFLGVFFSGPFNRMVGKEKEEEKG